MSTPIDEGMPSAEEERPEATPAVSAAVGERRLRDIGKELQYILYKPKEWWLKRSSKYGVAVLVAIPFLFMFCVGFGYRLARPGVEFWSFSASVAQLITLISLLGLQRKEAREGLEGVSRGAAAAAWLALALAATLFFLGPRPAAYQLNKVGAEALARGDLATALERLQMAVGLDPRNAKAHFNLGDAREATGDFEQAILEYQRALELDDNRADVYNNLGRLYLRVRHDPDSALEVLLVGLAHSAKALDRAVLKKNLGWAYLEKRLPVAALEELDAANEELDAAKDELDAQTSVTLYRAEVDRLKALAYEARGEYDQAQISWADCLGHAQGFVTSDCQQATVQAGIDCINAQVWAAEARERMEKPEGGP